MPKVYHVPRWFLFGNNGAGGLPNIALVANDLPEHIRIRVLNNELIHIQQQIECSPKKSIWTWRGYIIWIFIYIYYNILYGYLDNPMEIDSREWDSPYRFEDRPVEYWKTYDRNRNTKRTGL